MTDFSERGRLWAEVARLRHAMSVANIQIDRGRGRESEARDVLVEALCVGATPVVPPGTPVQDGDIWWV